MPSRRKEHLRTRHRCPAAQHAHRPTAPRPTNAPAPHSSTPARHNSPDPHGQRQADPARDPSPDTMPSRRKEHLRTR
ncbi:hypothetical protein ACFCYB_06970, partial [Streptomyces sp. NPDC056309]